MIFKEKGYDEFLAEKIRQAELSMEQGKGVSKAQMQLKMQKLLSELEREQNEQYKSFSTETVYG
ncbi:MULTISPECIES: hypothetical protein [unclassified Mannheimia]|uniref:hypothetical protein n=1 Tax=unclassified Mannheimia TaxID=2645054 RepID=UPI00359D5CBC